MQIKTYGIALLMAALPFAAMAQSAVPQSQDPARAEAREKVRAACAADVQKFCATVERGKGAMRECLQANETQLSDACKSARAERAAARAAREKLTTDWSGGQGEPCSPWPFVFHGLRKPKGLVSR